MEPETETYEDDMSETEALEKLAMDEEDVEENVDEEVEMLISAMDEEATAVSAEKTIADENVSRVDLSKAYGSQVSEIDSVSTDDTVEKEASKPKTRKPKKRKDEISSAKPKALPKRPEINAEALSSIYGDDAEIKFSQMEGLPKKVRAKAVNFYQSVIGGAHMSLYTKYAIELLKKKGVITSIELKIAFLNKGYTDATARSQADQMMRLLPFVGIANIEGRSLQLAAPLVTPKDVYGA